MASFVREHIDIIPIPIKDISEKCPDVLPGGAAMKLDRAYHAVVSGCHPRPFIAAVMEGVVPLDGQLPDDPFGQVVVQRQFTVLQISKDLVPKMFQVVEGFRVTGTSEFRFL